MRQKRMKFTPAFKAKVSLEAVKEQMTLAEIAKKYSVSPYQINKWKKLFVQNSSQAFGEKGNVDVEKEMEKLYSKIGKLEVEREFLKKSLWKTGL